MGDAIDAYRDTLLECTRDRVPLEWSAAQNSLGNTLRTLGERESGTARLEEALRVYRDALLERTSVRVRALPCFGRRHRTVSAAR
jgi:hypothetical protein